MKEINCFSCRKPQPYGMGMIHDDKNNLICYYCNKIIFSTTHEGDVLIRNNSGVMSYALCNRKEPLPIKMIPDEVHEECYSSLI